MRLAPSVVLVALVASVNPVRGDGVLFVRASASGLKTGASWADAFNDLQDALDAARARLPEPTEIWVAEGVYRPDRGTHDRLMSCSLPDGVELYGGFAGGETERCERDVRAHETIFSGDLLGNDHLTPPVTSDCCVETNMPGCEDAGCVERVEEETSRRCALFWDSYCATLAQSLCCDLCRPQRCDNSHALLTSLPPDLGAVIDGFTIMATEETFDGFGEAGVVGSGVFADGSGIVVRNCLFQDNASQFGGAIHVRRGAATVEDSAFLQNVKHNHTQVVGGPFTELVVSRCAFEYNDGGGVGLDAGSVRESRFVGNRGSAISTGFDPVDVVDCVFVNNQGRYGGAIDCAGAIQVSNCAFFGNTAEIAGGAVFNFFSGVAINNSVFSDNTAGQYGGAVAVSGPVQAQNCVFVNNTAVDVGGVHSLGGTFRNSIFRGNSDKYGVNEDSQIDFSVEPPLPTLRYCDIEGWTGMTVSGIGIVDVDPLFVDADGVDDMPGTEDDDFQLSPDSPLINAGNPNPPYPAYDFDHHPRPLCGRVDIGAFEFGFGDFDCDRTVTLADFAEWPGCASLPGSDGYRADACRAFDSDADTAIDLRDFSGLQLLLSR